MVNKSCTVMKLALVSLKTSLKVDIASPNSLVSRAFRTMS